jgi:TP901 family phage tail tape measure protein
MSDKKVEVILSGKDAKLIDALRRGEKAIRAFGDKSLGAFKKVNQAIVSSYGKLGALEKIGIGVGFTVAAKNVIEFDGALRKIGRSGGWSREDVAGLRKEILDLGQTMPVTKDQFAEMARELNATGIPLAMIKNILPDVGKGAKAAGVDTGIYAATVGELLDKYKVAASDLPALQDQLTAALKFEDVRGKPEEFLQSIQALSKTMQLMKSQGMGNVTPLMALMAQLTSFTGSSGEAAGALDGLFNGLLRISKNKDINAQLKSRGIEFFNADGSVKNIGELLPMIRKFGEELKKSGTSAEAGALAVFGRPDAAKSVMIIMQTYDEIIKKQGELGKSGGAMGKDYAEVQESMSSKLVRFQNQIDNFNVTHMSTALKYLSSVLDYLNAHPIIAKGLMTAARRGRPGPDQQGDRGGKGIGSMFGGKGGKGIAGGLTKGAAPVFVVNMPGGGFGGGGGIPGLPGGAGGGLMALLGKASLVLGTAITAYQAGSAFESKFIKGRLGEGAYDYFHGGEAANNKMQDLLWQKYYAAKESGDREAMKSLLNQIKLTVNIDKNGRVSTDSDSDDMNTNIDVERGEFMLN